ncbi:MAG: hypothetical protein CFE37_04190 [Alphaproteobacteria bacterium PA4]|nr:MAG: hypothetical protein CFE37_04190 [Alphaproteobacteria bacterium PA4]
MNAPASVDQTVHARDAGLVRSIGPWPLAIAYVGMLLGSSVFVVPATMAAAVGPWAPLAYLACALVIGCMTLCFAEAASRVPTSGGITGFVDHALGPFWSLQSGMLLWASLVLAAGGIAAAVADTVAEMVPALADGPARAAVIMAMLFGLAVINAAGVGGAARFVSAATLIKLVPLAVFLGVGLWFVTPAHLLAAPAAVAGGSDVGRAAIVGIFMFFGIESSMAVSGEVRDPARTIPRAAIAALIGYALLCIAIQLVAQGLLGAALATAKAPLADAIATVSLPLRLLLLVGAALSMFGWLASDALSSPRILFALARDGFLPAALGRVHPRTRAPWIASFTHAAVAIALAISGSFAALVALSSLTALLVYLIAGVAVLRLRRDGVALAGPPLRVPGLQWLWAIGSLAILWVTAQSTREEAIGIAIYIALTTLLYRVRRSG